MAEWGIRAVYDMFVAVYGISLVAFFVDMMQPRRALNRAAVALLFAAFLLETAFLFARLYALGYMPVYSPFDVSLLVSWLILLVALCVNAFFRLDVLFFFINVLGFALVVADAILRQKAAGVGHPSGDLLMMHIASAIASYAAFGLSGVFAGMYWVQHRYLVRKRWESLYFRLPSLETLDQTAYRLVLIGFPLLTVAIALGAVWEKISLGHYVWLDSKPILTLLSWLMYGVYLALRTKAGWGGVALARFLIAALAIVLLNLWLGSQFSSFHHL